MPQKKPAKKAAPKKPAGKAPEKKAIAKSPKARSALHDPIPSAAELYPSTEPPVVAKSPPLPEFVKTASPADRKAVVQALAETSGVPKALAAAPWKKTEAPAKKTEPQGAPAAASPPKFQMMKAPAPSAPATRLDRRPVLVDTNALMMQFQFHIDIEKELRRLLDFAHEICVPSTVVEELDTIAKEGRGKDAGEARMAVELARTFRIVDSPGEGDTSILRLAEKLNAIVVTNDKILRARLRAKDIPNIYMRSSAFLTVEGHISGI